MFPQVSPLWMHVSFGKALDALPDATLPIIIVIANSEAAHVNIHTS